MTAEADERTRAEDAPRDRDRQVILAQMQDVGAGRERDVRPVVDRQQTAMPPARVGEHLKQREFLGRLEALLPQLHDVDPGTEDSVEERGQVAPGSPGVGAQVQSRVGQPCPHITCHPAIQSSRAARPPTRAAAHADIR